MARIPRYGLRYVEATPEGVIPEFRFALASDKRTRKERVPRDLHYTVLASSATLDLVSV